MSTITFAVTGPASISPTAAGAATVAALGSNNGTFVLGQQTSIALLNSQSGQTQVYTQTITISAGLFSSSTNTSTTSTVTSSTGSSASSTATVGSNGANNTTESIAPAPTPKYSDGSVAGIAIACIVLTALLAALIAWLLFRRRTATKKYRRSKETATLPQAQANGSTGPAAGSFELGQISAVDARLPAPLEESTIAKRFSTLETHIYNHVRNFYQAGSTSDTQRSAESSLESVVGSQSPVTAKRVMLLLSDAKTRTVAIQFVLAWTILQGIEPTLPADRSLLPPELLTCHQTAKLSVSNPTDRTLLLSKWRHITGVLLRSKYDQLNWIASDPRQGSIERTANLLNSALANYAITQSDTERRTHLEDLIKLGARLGYILFTQPSGWRFDWGQARQGNAADLVVYPALLQVVDDQGCVRPQPQPYGELKVVRAKA